MLTRDLVISYLKQGFNNIQIQQKTGLKYRTICYHTAKLRKSNPDLFKIIGYDMKVDHYFFRNIDSEIKAYLLGYFLADGCVSIEPKKRDGKIYSYNKRIAFTVSIDDLYCLKLFKKYISPTAVISQYHNPVGAVTRKISCRLRISSKILVNDLITIYGIKPRKTWNYDFTFPFEKIPNHLIRHFIRGFFDGDGWLTGVTTKHNKNTKIAFVGTSKPFLTQLGEQLSKDLNCSYSFYQEPTCCRIKLKGLTRHNKVSELLTMNIIDYFYKDSKYFLNRKRFKFKCSNKQYEVRGTFTFDIAKIF